MPIGYFLRHRVSIIRRQAMLDGFGEPTLDDYGQPITSTVTLASSVPCSIQPKSAREQAAVHEAGVALSDHTVYLYPQDITTADAIYHSSTTCPVVTDLPTGTYQITGVPDAAGYGHHLEVDAHLVTSADVTEPVAS